MRASHLAGLTVQDCLAHTQCCAIRAINAQGGAVTMRIREHGDYGHGLEPGTDHDLNCLSCRSEKDAGTPPRITGEDEHEQAACAGPWSGARTVSLATPW